MTIKIIYIESTNPLGTQDGEHYTVFPDEMPAPDFTETH